MPEEKTISIPEAKFQELLENQAALINEVNALKEKSGSQNLIYRKKIKEHYATVRIIEGMPVVGIIEQESGDKIFEGNDLGQKWGNLYIELLVRWEKKEKKVTMSYKKFLNQKNNVTVKLLKKESEQIESLPIVGAQTAQQVTVDENYNVKVGENIPLFIVDTKDTYTIEFMEGKLKGQTMDIEAEYLNL